MSTFKSIQPSAAAIHDLQVALNFADSTAQRNYEKVQVAAKSICLLLKEPDSASMRLSIRALCEIIDFHSFDVANTINSVAEEKGAHYVDEADEKDVAQIRAAVRGEKAHG